MWTAGCVTPSTHEAAVGSVHASTGREPDRQQSDAVALDVPAIRAPTTDGSAHHDSSPRVAQDARNIRCPQQEDVSAPVVLQREEPRLTVAHFDGVELVLEHEVPTNGRVAEAHACRTAGPDSGSSVSWVEQTDRRVLRVSDRRGADQIIEFDEPVRAHAWVRECSAIIALVGTPAHGAVITRSIIAAGNESETLHVAGRSLRSLRALGDQRHFAIGDESRLLVLDVLSNARRWVEVGALLEGSFDVHECGERLVRIATSWDTGDRASHGIHRVFDQALGPEPVPVVVAGLGSLHVQTVVVEGNILFAVGWPLVDARGRAVRRNPDGYPVGPPSLFGIDLSSSNPGMVGPIARGVRYFDR